MNYGHLPESRATSLPKMRSMLGRTFKRWRGSTAFRLAHGPWTWSCERSLDREAWAQGGNASIDDGVCPRWLPGAYLEEQKRGPSGNPPGGQWRRQHAINSTWKVRADREDWSICGTLPPPHRASEWTGVAAGEQ